IEIGPAFHQARHGGEMENDLHVGDDGLEFVRAQIEPMETKIRRLASALEILFLDRRRVVGNKCVYAHDFVAAAKQGLAQMGTNKPGGAGDETFHSNFSPERGLRPRRKIRNPKHEIRNKIKIQNSNEGS